MSFEVWTPSVSPTGTMDVTRYEKFEILFEEVVSRIPWNITECLWRVCSSLYTKGEMFKSLRKGGNQNQRKVDPQVHLLLLQNSTITLPLLVLEGNRITIKTQSEIMQISLGTAHMLITEKLNMRYRKRLSRILAEGNKTLINYERLWVRLFKTIVPDIRWNCDT